MYSLGIPDDVKAEVVYRAEGICECRNKRHQFNEGYGCGNQVGSGDSYFVIYPIGRAPIAKNVRLICRHCYLLCYGAVRRRHLKKRR